MPEQNNSANSEVLHPEVGDIPPETPSTSGVNTLAIQNNNYFTQQIDLVALEQLTTKDPEIAKMYMAIQQEQFEHSKSMDSRIISIEEKEQDARHEDIPYQRKYASRAQLGSIAIAVLALVTSVIFGMLGMEKVAIAAIAIPIGVLAVNFLGVRNKGQK